MGVDSDSLANSLISGALFPAAIGGFPAIQPGSLFRDLDSLFLVTGNSAQKEPDISELLQPEVAGLAPNLGIFPVLPCKQGPTMQETGSTATADTTIRSPANPRPHHAPAEARGLPGFAGVAGLRSVLGVAEGETISGQTGPESLLADFDLPTIKIRKAREVRR